MNEINGVICINKPQDFTSFDVVAIMRRAAGTRKIGHGGTLDPMATGVLPIYIGRAAKTADLNPVSDKRYRATFRLGVTTDTEDVWGKVLTKSEKPVTLAEITDAVKTMQGDIMQIPPMYSAIKVDGKKLYELARAGQEVERKARHVVINALNITEIQLPYVTMEVSCSKGTYIRTLCQDIGEKLGCGACMTELVRLKVGAFDIAHAWTLAQIQEMAACSEEEVRRHIVPVEEMLSDYPEFKTTDAFSDKMLANGNWLPREQVATSGGDASAVLKDGMQVRMYSSTGNFTAIYQYVAVKNSLKNIKMFV